MSFVVFLQRTNGFRAANCTQIMAVGGRDLIRFGAIAASVLLLGSSAYAGEVSEQMQTTAVVSGHVGGLLVDLTNPGGDPEPTDAVGYLLGADGFFNHWFTGNVAFQGDLNVEISGPLGFYDEPVYGRWLSGAGHLAYRDPEAFAAGVFGALQSASYFYPEYDETYAVPYGILGVEGQVYTDTLTFYGQAGIGFDLDPAPDPVAQLTRDYGQFAYVRGVLRYFPTDNVKLSVEGLYGVGSIRYGEFMEGEADADVTITSVKLGADYRPDDSDLSYFVSYQGTLLNTAIATDSRSSLEHRLLAGVKFDIGAETLKQRDREGVTWDVPQLAGMMGQADQLSYCFAVGECPYATDLP